MAASQRTRQLTDRGQAILLQAYEDLVTPEFVLQRHFPGQTIQAAKSEIRRLCKASLLYSLPMAGRQRYYRLTRHGARAIQVHARHTRPLKRQGLVNRFAVSWFFNIRELNQCYRFDPLDWVDEFPAFANRRYWRRPFYIRETPQEDQTRFGVVIVDHGASRRRLTSKITDLLAELIQVGVEGITAPVDAYDALVQLRPGGVALAYPAAASEDAASQPRIQRDDCHRITLRPRPGCARHQSTATPNREIAMSLPKTTYTAPSLRNVQHKSDIIDREGLDKVQCDLDYAPMREFPAKSGRIVTIALLQATIVGTIGAWLLGEFVVPFIWMHVPLPLAGVIALLAAAALAINASRSLEENAIRLLKNTWIAVWSTAAILSTPFLMRPFIAALWLLTIAMPLAIYFAYRFTTFAVYWITGHPLGDGDVMLQCRDIWQHRYECVPNSIPGTLSDSSRDRERWQYVLRTIKSHDHAFLWCCVAVAAALSVTWCSRESFRASVIGLHSVVSILFGLFVTAIVRCGGRLPLRLVKRMLLRWFMYDWDAQATPWMFQSPCGELFVRRRWFWAVLATVAVAVNHLAGAYIVIAVPLSHSMAIFWPEWTQPVLMTLISALCCLAVPIIVLALIVCIIAGPAFSAFDELYSE